ncbi:MAG: flavodoxin family protein [Armatimonadia bacterium]|nr:flavodoxin family protein [Armatimonadia bacterium]
MADILVTYFSKTGHTEAMAECIANAAREVEGVKVEVRPVEDVQPDDLLDFQGIIMGSPVYYGTMAAPLKALIDASVKHHGKLEGKVGGAFSSSGVIGGGNETTLLDIIACQLVHGMIVKGVAKGPHYGPTCQGEPNEQAQSRCDDYGRDIAELCVQLFG